MLWTDVFAAAAFVCFAIASVVLAVVDLRSHRLPNAIVLPLWLAGVALFAAASAAAHDGEGFLRALIGSGALFAFYLVLRLLSPRGMGGGDVKLAGAVGLHLAWLGWDALALGALAGFVLGGAYGLVLVAARRADRRTAIPFGPWMLAGAWIAVLGAVCGIRLT
ncbi:prepilin peptidase [Microbacterium ulmi]|uniref:Prepilin peptidase n=1 Tax=Microbacterium ulmi TaxID=179095 RepID=A0A7Y2LXN3_9MICO|nr:prepilin signal peptidase PulO-like enzyme (type II secretory pathway) [Microbacterium ulmi]NNH02731.1 prepilin peptidase [Microbacterium ulmi]